MISTIAAYALGIAGVGCLFGSWKDRLPAQLRPALLGWLLLIGSGCFAVQAGGAEFGTTLIFTAPALVAWLLVAINLELRQAKVRKRKLADKVEPIETDGSRTLSRHILLFVITVPLSAVAATFFSVALARALPFSYVSHIAFAILLMPFLWGCAAYWALADSKLARPVTTIVVLGLIGVVTAGL
jgi:hypothetical protein